MASWKLPLIVAAIAVPIVGGFWLGGPGVGVAVGALAAVTILVTAATQRPRGPIVSAPSEDGRRHVLVVITCPVEDPGEVRRVVASAGLEGSEDEDILVLAPAKIRFLDRWTSDVEPARRKAQQNLVVTVAALARAQIDAEARVGDENVVQAVEDQLQSFPADEVVLVTRPADDGRNGTAAAAELASRLAAGFSHVVLGADAG